jgi:hypothetical protein
MIIDYHFCQFVDASGHLAHVLELDQVVRLEDVMDPVPVDQWTRNELTWWCEKTFRGPILTSPLGANFDPQERSCPPGVKLSPGVKFSVWPSILLNSRECSPLGVNKGVNIPPRGQISPLGARGEVKNGPLVGFLGM